MPRTASAADQIAKIQPTGGLTYDVSDIVQAVEDELPGDYPAPAAVGVAGRRNIIAQMARNILAADKSGRGPGPDPLHVHRLIDRCLKVGTSTAWAARDGRRQERIRTS